MSEHTHTPGPWFADPLVAISDRPDLPCVVDGHKLVIAQCWDDGHTEDECEANARLIASAPDLLGALEGYAKNYLLDEYENPELCYDDTHRAAVAKVFAAIASARGEG